MSSEERPTPKDAVADYEALRKRVLDGSHGDRELGLGLLMRQGLAAWLRAWWTCPRPRSTPSAPAVELPGGVRGEVTRMLVTMALGASQMEIQQ